MKALFDDDEQDSSFALRMVQMQFLAMLGMEDTALSLEYCVRQGLQGLRTFIACMMRTKWTDEMVHYMERTQEC